MRDFKTFFYNKLKFASNIYISFRDRRSIWLALPGNFLDLSIFPKSTVFGHPFGIAIRKNAIFGERCKISHGVTIGVRRTVLNPFVIEDAPIIGNDVYFGAYATVLGPIHIGDGARIGAHATVLADVPPGATVVGLWS